MYSTACLPKGPLTNSSTFKYGKFPLFFPRPYFMSLKLIHPFEDRIFNSDSERQFKCVLLIFIYSVQIK